MLSLKIDGYRFRIQKLSHPHKVILRKFTVVADEEAVGLAEKHSFGHVARFGDRRQLLAHAFVIPAILFR